MKKYLILLFVAAAAVFQSCDNNDDLWDAIDDLKGRVQALETQVDALNNNVEAMKALYNEGATISEVSETGGTYTLKLTDGTTLTLTQGSEAEAVIPVVSIDAQGNWQYTVDGGKSFNSLNVNAVAEDGVTPQFRVDEKTGVWQINTTGEESRWTNVKNTAGEDVSAIGGTVTDKFFDSVRTEGNVLYIKLLGGEELQIPIVEDFFCRIVTTTEGVQTFGAGETKRFVVEIRGVETWSVTCPEGWTAHLTEPASEQAELVVTAPGTGASTLGTRATANSSQDVAILATTGKYSCISKIQVESTGQEVVAPTVSVSNSATLTPTVSTLSFDVELSANADGWKYICQKSDVAAPEVAAILETGVAGQGTSVTVENLEDNISYTIYVVAYTGDLTSEVASATNTTLEAVATEVDYYQDYQDGKDVLIGDLTVNSATYPDARLLKPSEITNSTLQEGGLIFVDNGDASDLSCTIDGTSLRVGQSATAEITILIGRYAERAQAEFSMPELRCEKSVAIKNLSLKVNAGVNYNFSTTNASMNPDLYLVDCTISMGRYLMYDVNPNYSFRKMLLDNSIVQYPTLTTQPSIYAMQTKTSGDSAKTSFPQESMTFTNNVLYHDTPLQAHVINLGSNNAFFQTSGLSVTVSGNTLYNIYQPNILIRAYILSSLNVSRNVGYYDGSANAKNYLTGVYDKTNFPESSATVSYNYLYTTDVTSTNFWSVVHTGSYKGSNNDTGDAASTVPFLSTNPDTGYFPINTTVVTTGAGATYDTKLWMKFE